MKSSMILDVLKVWIKEYGGTYKVIKGRKGDRLDEYGNDRPLADALTKNKLGLVVEVKGWEDTWSKLK